MTELLLNPKIKPEHLVRKAIVYLRQSSERQVRQNKESQLLQYAMAERVRELSGADFGIGAGSLLCERLSGRKIVANLVKALLVFVGLLYGLRHAVRAGFGMREGPGETCHAGPAERPCWPTKAGILAAPCRPPCQRRVNGLGSL